MSAIEDFRFYLATAGNFSLDPTTVRKMAETAFDEGDSDMKAIVDFAKKHIGPENIHQFYDDIERYFGTIRFEKLIE